MSMTRRDSTAATAIAIVLGILSLFIAVAGFAFWPFAPEQGKLGFTLFGLEARSLSQDARLFVVVACAGALGGLLHGIRSLYWYVGNGEFKRSWSLMYLLLPITGAIMGIGFYFIIRGGLMSPSSNSGDTNPYGMAAVAFLFGLFSQQAALKLKDVFETLLASPAPGVDSLPQGAVPPVPPGFTLKADPIQNQPAAAGAKATFQLEATAMGGLTGEVVLDFAGVPTPGVATVSANPLSLAAGTNQATFEIDTAGVPAGSYPITITGTCGAHSQTATVTLLV